MKLERKCGEKIRDWYKDRESKKALLVTGARQVGKTYLIRQILKEEKADFVEVNLIETPEAVSVLEQAGTIDDLITGLSTVNGQRLHRGKTVIFIDEVQQYKEMVTKIKFYAEEGSFRYVLSGSLLGVELTGLTSSPVGYLTILKMFPLDFEEFTQITNINADIVNSLHESFLNRTPVMDAVNKTMLSLFARYLAIGGMPEAVSRFAETKNVNDVIQIHSDIRNLYKLDFTKYESTDKKLLLTNAYDLIPSELLRQNKRFIVSDLKKGLHFDRKEDTFLWLANAGVALPVYNSTEPRIPLKLNEKQSLFKLYLSDVGMLTSEYGMNTKRMILTGDRNLNAGGIYENAVAQELSSHHFPLYYYNSKRLGELDFVIEYRNKVLPIEVKSGKDYHIHSAISQCLANPEYEMNEGIVLADCNISQEEKITYLPIYMIMFLEQDDTELILDDLRF